jgi:hypothetical protein
MVEGLFEMIRSGQEDKVQNLLAMIRANASMASIATAIEEGIKSPEPSQKRKRSVSSSTSPKDRANAGDWRGSDGHPGQRDTIPEAGASGSETTTSNSASQPAPHWIPSSNDSIRIPDLTLGSNEQPRLVVGLDLVRIFFGGPYQPGTFLISLSLAIFWSTAEILFLVFDVAEDGGNILRRQSKSW